MVKKEKKSSKKFIISIIVVVVILAALFGLYKTGIIKLTSQGEENPVLATVGEKDITQQDLDAQYEMFFLITGYPEEARLQITKELYLEQMITEEAMVQEAEELGFTADDISTDDLKAALENFLAVNSITTQELAERLIEKGLTVEQLQDYFKKQLMLTTFLNDTILSKVTVLETEVKELYNQNSESFIPQEGQIRAKHILVETKEEAEDIITKLRTGSTFEELAIELSLDTGSGARGGQLGFFNKEAMVAEFGEAAFNLRENQISKPVETQYGWHVIQRQTDKVTMTEAYDSLEQSVLEQKQQAALQIYIQQIRAKAMPKEETEEVEETEEEEEIEEVEEEVEEVVEEETEEEIELVEIVKEDEEAEEE